MLSLTAARELLQRHGQEQLLAFYDQLGEVQRADLLEQIASIDFPRLDELIRTHVLARPEVALPEEILPAPMAPARPTDEPTRSAHAAARRRGEELIAAGKVAALVVAGGAGTRLGFDGPKGCLPVTPARGKCLFAVFAEQLLATRRRYGAAVPWYVMTSPANDAETRRFFEAHDHFGLPAGDVVFFTQGQMPAVGLDGKVLLAEKGRIAQSPDGHGGCLTALRRSGALDDMAGRGVEQISYFQVDNPLVRCVDPLFLGLHDAAGAGMSAKALPKRDPLEKLGNFCLVDGKVTVIEYSDLPEELAFAVGDDGRLKFSAGSIAIHVLTRAFAEELTAGGSCRLPFHRAEKKASCLDADGNAVEPDRPNAVKCEMFIFDALPLSARAVILQTFRDEEFSPVKNASGADSLATSRHDQVRRAANWLESAGVEVPRDAEGQIAAVVEISPLLALDAAQLAERLTRPVTIKPGEEAYLE